MTPKCGLVMEFVRRSEPSAMGDLVPSRGLPPDLIEDLNLAEKMEAPKSICAVRLSIEQETSKVEKGDNEAEEKLLNVHYNI